MTIVRMLAVKIIILFTCVFAEAQQFPEFTGNYYLCGSAWCEIRHHELNTMQLLIRTGSGNQTVGYGGYFEIREEVPTINSQKPRFLFYMGRENVDHRYTALVELEPMQYNNAPISVMDGTDYQLKAVYNSKTTNMLWTFKREIPVRYKPIEGKAGMFIVEPTTTLPEGFYAVDYGVPEKSGHSGLRTAPEAMGFQKTMNVQTAIPFLIGDKNKIVARSTGNKRQGLEASSQGAETSETVTGNARPDITINVGDIIKGLFGK